MGLRLGNTFWVVEQSEEVLRDLSTSSDSRPWSHSVGISFVE